MTVLSILLLFVCFVSVAKFECNACPRFFNSQEELKNHKSTIHSNPRSPSDDRQADPLVDPLAGDLNPENMDQDPDDPEPDEFEEYSKEYPSGSVKRDEFFLVNLRPEKPENLTNIEPRSDNLNLEETRLERIEPRSDNLHLEETRLEHIAKKTRVGYTDDTRLNKSGGTRLDPNCGQRGSNLNQGLGNNYQNFMLPSINQLTLTRQVGFSYQPAHPYTKGWFLYQPAHPYTTGWFLYQPAHPYTTGWFLYPYTTGWFL